jgi:RecA-family ATPase
MFEEEQNKKFEILSFSGLLSQTSKLPKKETIWAGIKEGSFGIVYGPSKSGKTTFCENLALSLVVGKENFWGRKLYDGKPHKILFIGLEENCQPRADRGEKQISLFSEDERNLVGENYLQPGCNFKENIHGDSEWKLLRAAIEESEAKIVFIDSMTRLYTGSIEESNTAMGVSLRLRMLSRDLGITLIVIHHTTKNQGKAMTQDSIAGSRVIAQEADFAIGINKTFIGKRYFKEVFYRYEKHSDEDVQTFTIDENQWLVPREVVKEYKLFKTNDGRRDNNSFNQFKGKIDEVSDEKGFVLTKSLQEKFVDTKIISKPTLHSYLKKMCDEGDLKKMANGVYQQSNFGEEESDG